MRKSELYYRDSLGRARCTNNLHCSIFALRCKAKRVLGPAWNVRGGKRGQNYMLSCMAEVVGQFHTAQDCYEAIRTAYWAQQACHL